MSEIDRETEALIEEAFMSGKEAVFRGKGMDACRYPEGDVLRIWFKYGHETMTAVEAKIAAEAKLAKIRSVLEDE